INGMAAGELTEGVPANLYIGDGTAVVGNRSVDNRSFLFPGTIGSAEFVAAASTAEQIRELAKKTGATAPNVAPMTRVTNPPGYHWFGYYDKFQFSPDQRYLLAGEVAFENRKPMASDEVTIGMIDLQNQNQWIPIGKTHAWNWQQGSMLQWRPNSTEVHWNDRDDDRFVTRVYDTKTQTTRTLPRPIYHVSPDGKFAIGADFSRIQDMRAGYGYAGIPDPNHDEIAPESSSIYRIDLDTGVSKDLVRLSDVAAIKGSGKFKFDNSVHYFNHLQFSPDGSKFLFLHRWIPKGRGFGTRFFTANIDGSNLQILSEDSALSHYVWRDNTSVLIWSGQRKGYAIYELGKGYVSTVLEAENGHQSYVPGTNNRWILTDTYPDGDRAQLLYLYDTKNDEVVVVASKRAPKKYTGEFRVDFHPRLSRDGKKVVIDGAFEDLGRQQYMIDISSIIDTSTP
ncbi:MAG: hypothetical protein R3E66_24420, partial [bacterium]